MFDKLLNAYDAKKKIIEGNNEALKKNLKNLNDPLTKEILSGLNDQVAVLHANQQIIEKETKNIKIELNKFYKEIENWNGLYEELNEKLMELGDVVNWAITIENNLKEVMRTE